MNNPIGSVLFATELISISLSQPPALPSESQPSGDSDDLFFTVELLQGPRTNRALIFNLEELAQLLPGLAQIVSTYLPSKENDDHDSNGRVDSEI